MKNKCVIAAAELVIFNLLSLFLACKLLFPFLGELAASTADADVHVYRISIFFTVYIAGMLLLGIHIYMNMIKPVSKAQKELEEAAQESKKAELIRKEFVANVSHELKTPLTSISGFIETLQQGAAEDPEIRTKFIDIIAIETSRLKRMIEDLLVLSDIENKKETADKKEFDVRGAVERTLLALEPIAEDKGVILVTSFDENICIHGSVDRFCQMMMNLIENAIKYSKQGGRIWICAENRAQKVQISVRDEGIGIAEEHLERLFERFYRVDKSRSAKAGGIGLGLSIVKHIAMLFGAELGVESKVGEGTVFYVTFER
ncbi:MAG: hypothetical protein HFE76_13690 [Firmicutes bacterium]|nr:hypothetical protein [Bacillota bacterium]